MRHVTHPESYAFVTSDVRQRRALRVLNVLNPHQPKTRIISYQELRNRLVVPSAAQCN